jgi:hypothetical protein
MMMRFLNDIGFAFATLLLLGGAAQAQSVSVQNSSQPDSDITLLSLPSGDSGFVSNSTVNFGAGNTDTISFTGSSGIYSGTASGAAAAPNTPTGADTKGYLAAEPNGNITLTYSSTQQNFNLLWGSVDASNTLNFYNGTTLVGSVSGSQIQADPNGAQNSTGSFFVSISNLASGFTSVVASSGTNPAFEFVPGVPQASPAPMGALGSTWWAGLLIAMGFFTLRRKMRD